MSSLFDHFKSDYLAKLYCTSLGVYLNIQPIFLIILVLDLTLKDDFLTKSKQFFRTVIENLDFSNPQEVTASINKFVDQVRQCFKTIYRPNLMLFQGMHHLIFFQHYNNYVVILHKYQLVKVSINVICSIMFLGFNTTVMLFYQIWWLIQ
jgi:hypothetical protein